MMQPDPEQRHQTYDALLEDLWQAYEAAGGVRAMDAAAARTRRPAASAGSPLAPGAESTGPPPASLIHGDLWGGNASFLGDGTPVIFDPATHYADREADLAMSELFGGFSPRFYDAYHSSWPLDDGHPERRTLYQLYHTLNHALLFGGGYASQARSMIRSLIAM